jgi:hypothetical protein
MIPVKSSVQMQGNHNTARVLLSMMKVNQDEDESASIGYLSVKRGAADNLGKSRQSRESQSRESR